METDIVRVLRVIEYIGTREKVEETVKNSIHGERKCDRDLVIRAATVGIFPEVVTGKSSAYLRETLKEMSEAELERARRLESLAKKNARLDKVCRNIATNQEETTTVTIRIGPEVDRDRLSRFIEQVTESVEAMDGEVTFNQRS